MYEQLPATLTRIDQQETKEELKRRHILHVEAEHSDDWLFNRLCDSLLAA